MQSRETTSMLNQELRNQLSAVTQQLRSVSVDRDALQRDRESLRAQIQQLSTQTSRLSERVDNVERLVMGIFEGRIWRTLTFLASPLKLFVTRK